MEQLEGGRQGVQMPWTVWLSERDAPTFTPMRLAPTSRRRSNERQTTNLSTTGLGGVLPFSSTKSRKKHTRCYFNDRGVVRIPKKGAPQSRSASLMLEQHGTCRGGGLGTDSRGRSWRGRAQATERGAAGWCLHIELVIHGEKDITHETRSFFRHRDK